MALFLHLSLVLLLQLINSFKVLGFQVPFQSSRAATQTSSSTPPLWMGLYDDPLPPRPPPSDKEPFKKESGNKKKISSKVSSKQQQKKKDGDDVGVSLEDVKADLYDMMGGEEWQELNNQQKYEKRTDKFTRPRPKDTKWLSGRENPKPVDDEPWYTG